MQCFGILAFIVFSVKNSPGGAILVIFSKQQCVWSASFLHSKHWKSWNGFFSGSCVLVLAKFLQFLRLFCSSFWNLFSTLQKYMLNVQISPPGASHLWQTAIFVQCFIPSLQQTLVIVERFSFNTVLVLDCQVLQNQTAEKVSEPRTSKGAKNWSPLQASKLIG